MIKLISKVLILILCVSFCMPVALADNGEISLYVNGERLQTDVAPILVDGRTLVPVRCLFEAFNASVEWIEETEQVIINSADTSIILKISSEVAFVNSSVIKLDVAPILENGRTLVPVRFISENLGYVVEWNDSDRSVHINSSYVDPDRTVITSIAVNESDYAGIVTIKADNFQMPEVSAAVSPLRCILDFKNGFLESLDGRIPFDSKGIKEVRYAQHDGYARVVIEAYGDVDFAPQYFDDYMTVKVIPDSTKPQINYTEQPVYNEYTENFNTPVVEGAPIVVIDAGHGGSDTGAIGYDDYGREVIRESETNLKIALGVQKYLADSGVNVIMTRTTDRKVNSGSTMDDLVARAEIANNAGASLFVSVHNNAFTSSSASGTLVLYADTENKLDYGVTSKTLAQNILRPLVKTMGLLDRGVVDSPKMVVLYKRICLLSL